MSLNVRSPLVRRQILEHIWYLDNKRQVPKPIIKALCDNFDCVMEYTRLIKNPPGAIRTMPQVVQEVERLKKDYEKIYCKKTSEAAPADAAVSTPDQSASARKGKGREDKKTWEKNAL